jgi:hypothetical protein
MLHQRRYVLTALSQRRQLDRDALESVVKVLAELTLADSLFEIAP